VTFSLSSSDVPLEEEYHIHEEPAADAVPLAGVIMQQCYPGGPLMPIPVHWTPYLDPNLVPGETAVTPLDPSFTHLLDESFKPLDFSKWTADGGWYSVTEDLLVFISHNSKYSFSLLRRSREPRGVE